MASEEAKPASRSGGQGDRCSDSALGQSVQPVNFTHLGIFPEALVGRVSELAVIVQALNSTSTGKIGCTHRTGLFSGYKLGHEHISGLWPQSG